MLNGSRGKEAPAFVKAPLFIRTGWSDGYRTGVYKANQYGAHRFEPIRVKIRNARRSSVKLDLDRHGFALAHRDTAVTDFFDEDQIKTVYYAETEDLVRRVTGARRVIPFYHRLRSLDPSNRDKSQVVGLVSTHLHTDHAASAGAELVPRYAGISEAADGIQRRVAVIQTWAALAGSIQTRPLAFCDVQTLAMDDLMSVRRPRPKCGSEFYVVAHNRKQRWYYFPKMTRSEAIIFKSYDSEVDGRARFAPHTSFKDPSVSEDAAPRQSIEVRTLALF